MNRSRAQNVPPQLAALLENFEAQERAKIEALFETALAIAKERHISDLWEQPELASTYWILLVSGINDADESRLAETMLKWKGFVVTRLWPFQPVDAS